MSKLALGTAQFGMDYGISNQRGKIPEREVFDILDKAIDSGVDMLDTAAGYGDSENILGKYLKGKGDAFKIISKLPKCAPDQVAGQVLSSLKKLNVSSLYGYLLHDFDSFKEHPEIIEILRGLKSKGIINKIGFSVYYPAEIDLLIDRRIEFDLVQAPYNVFDRRFESSFNKLKKRGVEIHARSAFLQGLVFKKPEELKGVLAGMRSKLEILGRIARDANKSIMEIVLGFARGNQLVDRVVLGVDNIANLEEIVAAEKKGGLSDKIMNEMQALAENNEDHILPFNWGKGTKLADKGGK